MADAAWRADLAFGFGEAAAHIAKGAVGVVGEAVDNHHGVARAKAFVARR